MRPSGLSTLILAALLGACSGETGGPLAQAPTGPAEPSEIILQAVDAGTGAALADDEMTVRHLVRFPITLDESAVEAVPSSQPYRIQHAVAWDNLVVEVRLEAPSYHRMDTVLNVARGESVGPITLRMTRRLTGAGRATSRPASGGSRPTAQANRPTSPTAAPDPDAGIDRTALQAGDRAFEGGQWAAATIAYLRMPTPPRRTGTYAREYAHGMVRLGASHINLGEFAGALDALETAVSFEDAGYTAYLLLGQAQCTVGRFDAGRESLSQIDRLAPTIPADEWGAARALSGFQRAHCTYQEFQRVDAALDILRVGGAAIREYEDFIRQGEALSPLPAPVSQALEEARTRIEEIRQRMRTGGVPEE